MRKEVLALLAAVLVATGSEAAKKPKFDYSVVFVPEEGGVKFEKITEDADMVAEYKQGRNRTGNLVKKATGIFGSVKTNVLDWWVIPQIALSPDGKRIGFRQPHIIPHRRYRRHPYHAEPLRPDRSLLPEQRIQI